MKVLTGDLLKSECQTLVNTVNCVGIMGKGIALEFKKQYPDMFKDYVAKCERKEVRLGRPYLFRRMFGPSILNFPTKDHWRSLAKLSDIEDGLKYLESHYLEWGITSLAVPPLGCGNGQLEWRVVGPTLYRSLARLAIPVELYAPQGTPVIELQSSFLDGCEHSQSNAFAGQRADSDQPVRISPAWIGLVEIVKRINDQPYHWPIGRTIFQKIAYVATVLGLPTGLEFEQASFGPFSRDLKSLEARLIGNGLLDEHRSGSMQKVEVGRTYDDARLAYRVELRNWDDLIERTVDLFMRVSSTNQAEIVATVMYAARRLAENEGVPSEDQVFDAVAQWKSRRKPPLDNEQVRETIQGLASSGWIELASHSTHGPMQLSLTQ